MHNVSWSDIAAACIGTSLRMWRQGLDVYLVSGSARAISDFHCVHSGGSNVGEHRVVYLVDAPEHFLES